MQEQAHEKPRRRPRHQADHSKSELAITQVAVVCLAQRLTHYAPLETQALLAALAEDLAAQKYDASWLVVLRSTVFMDTGLGA
jgi:hypothetical protein